MSGSKVLGKHDGSPSKEVLWIALERSVMADVSVLAPRRLGLCRASSSEEGQVLRPGRRRKQECWLIEARQSMTGPDPRVA